MGPPGRPPHFTEPEVDKRQGDKLNAWLPEFNKVEDAHGAADDEVTRSSLGAG